MRITNHINSQVAIFETIALKSHHIEFADIKLIIHFEIYYSSFGNVQSEALTTWVNVKELISCAWNNGKSASNAFSLYAPIYGYLNFISKGKRNVCRTDTFNCNFFVTFFFSFDAQHFFNSTFLHVTDCTEWVKWWAQHFNEQCTIIPPSKNYHFMQKFSFLHIVCRCFLYLLLFLTRRKMHISNEIATSLQLWYSKNVLIFNESTFIHIMVIWVFLMVFHEPNYARHEMNIFI